MTHVPPPPPPPPSSESALTPESAQPLAPNTASKRIVLAALALSFGILAFLLGLVPFLGAVLGIAAVVLGVVALLKHQSKGLSITGLVLGAVGLITSVVVTIGLIAATMTLPSTMGLSLDEIAELESAEVAPEGATETDEIFPSDVGHGDFSEVNAAELEAILADPDAHAEQAIIIYASWGEPLVSEELDAQGMCLVRFRATADSTVGEDEPVAANVIAVGEGAMYECALQDQLVSTSGGSVSKVYAIVMGTLPMTDDEGQPYPGLLVFDIE